MDAKVFNECKMYTCNDNHTMLKYQKCTYVMQTKL